MIKPKIIIAYEKFMGGDNKEHTYSTYQEAVKVWHNQKHIYFVASCDGYDGEDGASIKEYSEEEFNKEFSLIEY